MAEIPPEKRAEFDRFLGLEKRFADLHLEFIEREKPEISDMVGILVGILVEGVLRAGADREQALDYISKIVEIEMEARRPLQ